MSSKEKRQRHARVMRRQKKCEAGVRRLCRDVGMSRTKCKKEVNALCPPPRFKER